MYILAVMTRTAGPMKQHLPPHILISKCCFISIYFLFKHFFLPTPQFSNFVRFQTSSFVLSLSLGPGFRVPPPSLQVGWSVPASGTSNLPNQPPKGKGREEARSDPRRGYTEVGEYYDITLALYFYIGADSEASSPHGRNLSRDLTQKVRPKEVLCLSESPNFYTESLTRRRFLLLIPPPSSLYYRGCHLPPDDSMIYSAD